MISGLGNPHKLCQPKLLLVQIQNLQSFSEGTVATCCAFNQTLINGQLAYIAENGPGKFDTKEDCDWSRSIGDSQESPCLATKQTMTKSGQFSIQVMYTCN